jgi:hypothetical protein
MSPPPQVVGVVVMTILVISTYFFCAVKLKAHAGEGASVVDVGGAPKVVVSEMVVGVVPAGHAPPVVAGT